jgi:hypothetical protein
LRWMTMINNFVIDSDRHSVTDHVESWIEPTVPKKKTTNVIDPYYFIST